jgi:hypothetical protein
MRVGHVLDLFARNLFTNNLSHGLLQYFVSSSTDARKGWVHLNIRNNAELVNQDHDRPE